MNIGSLRIGRVLLGILGLSSILIEVLALLNEGNFRPVNFFSFFTILSNLLAGIFLIYFGLSNNISHRTQLIRGAITLYMAMTGVIFAVLLAGLEGVRLTAVPRDNIVLHYIMPIVVVADWFLYPPKEKLSGKSIPLWVVFPIVYVAYTMIRGAVVSWYPYPFFNPSASSYAQVFITLAALTVCVVAGAYGIKKYSDTRIKQDDVEA